MPTREELIKELRNVADELGRTPSIREFRKLSDVPKYQIMKEFGSWNAARNAAELEFIQTKYGAAEGDPEGYVPRGPSPSISDEELHEEIHRLTEELGRIPTKIEMADIGKYGDSTYEKRFGSWRDAVAEAGYEPRPSMEDQSGENNYNWKGGYGNYSRDWDGARKRALERDNYECQICGRANEAHQEDFGKSLDIHHIRPARKFDDQEEAHQLSNLITLCRSCHARWEGIPLKPDR